MFRSVTTNQHLKSWMVKELDEGDRGRADHHRVRGVHAVQDLKLMLTKILIVDHLGHWECLKIDLITCVLPGSTMEFQIGDIEP